jgi:hypothetical protein
VTVLTWRQVDFGGIVLAGVAAGYVMALAGLWAAKLPGLVAFDIADFGRRYMVSDRPSAWIVGFATHLINSVLLTLAWASLIEPNIAAPRWLEGIGFGLFLAIAFAGLLIAPLAGLGVLGRRTGSASFAATDVFVHLIWGFLIGVLYVPR